MSTPGHRESEDGAAPEEGPTGPSISGEMVGDRLFFLFFKASPHPPPATKF